MKQFLKHTARVLGFALGLIVILIAVSFVMTPKDNTERAGMLSERAYGFLAEPENSLDALFFGDSEGYRAFIPLQMWDEYGITSYVCNTSSQQLLPDGEDAFAGARKPVAEIRVSGNERAVPLCAVQRYSDGSLFESAAGAEVSRSLEAFFAARFFAEDRLYAHRAV